MRILRIPSLYNNLKDNFLQIVAFVLFLFSGSAVLSGNVPTARITRTEIAPRIDGNINDKVWENATVLTEFREYEPVLNANPRMPTKVMLLYDNEAIYVAAIMSDRAPDSIARQLGERDNEDLNADYFGIGFDTYCNQQDAYYFLVSASGVQVDGRELDDLYNAVWESSVKITSAGWVAELRIPYSALRFPKKETQEWGLQVVRKIRRYREEIQWAPEEKGSGNSLVYWGKLSGFDNIEPPLRLSFTPYVSGNFQHNSDKAFKNDPITYAYNGGMDIKLGLNESFTMDMILLPDFSQVQSDKIQKNLTAYELIYDENRTFFNEGTDLFQKGNLFYSRRIGRTPLLYYSASSQLLDNEIITNNPVNARLLNATKLSGRTANGLGIGFFNAITGNTSATATDTITGEKREILTDPLTNYNIVVVDQALPNNSSVYFINTNVTRPSGWDDSNVTGGGANLGDRSKTYFLGMNFAASKWNKAGSEVLYSSGENYPGYNYGIYLMKSRGKFQFSVYQSAMDKHFNINDLGINRTNNQQNRGVYLSYRIYEPFGIFLNFSQSFGIDQIRRLDGKENVNATFTYKGNSNFRNYLTVWWGITVSPIDRYDFYEPRRDGWYYIAPGYTQEWIGYSSDYRKKFALDGQFYYTRDFDQMHSTWFEIEPIFRFNNRFSIRIKNGIGSNPDDIGYIWQNTETIWFGKRDIKTLENSFSGKYMISRLISVSLWLRHYWQKGDYSEFYTLNDKGILLTNNDFVYKDYVDFNYNSFNIDMVLGWEFAPGSMLSVVWKNAIETENQLYQTDYLNNLDHMFAAPQLNMISIKALYHLDYLSLKRKKK
ncbi:MAG: carbohydrate binding family 9 domain-containing protein [Bacteroidales bacterium]|nr:carbohydrate binding family 9 domain-containing protein [Bacteroidales bacterium]